MLRLLLLLFCLAAATACNEADRKAARERTELDSALARTGRSGTCTALREDESAIVLPHIDCNSCAQVTAALLAVQPNGYRVFTPRLYELKLRQELGSGLPACLTPFGFEDSGLDRVRIPSLLLRRAGRVEEVIELNGPGIGRLKALGLMR